MTDEPRQIPAHLLDAAQVIPSRAAAKALADAEAARAATVALDVLAHLLAGVHVDVPGGPQSADQFLAAPLDAVRRFLDHLQADAERRHAHAPGPTLVIPLDPQERP